MVFRSAGRTIGRRRRTEKGAIRAKLHAGDDHRGVAEVLRRDRPAVDRGVRAGTSETGKRLESEGPRPSSAYRGGRAQEAANTGDVSGFC